MTELTIEKRVAFLRMARPEKRNALSPELVEALKQQLQSLQTNEQVKVLVLEGKGKAFCAGADLAYLQKLQGFSAEENRQDSAQLAGLFKELLLFPKPTIASVNGPAIAGGCGLALACDYIYALEEASFGFSEVRIGFVPAIVSLIVRKKWGLHAALELLVGGHFYKGKHFAARHWINGTAQDRAQLQEVVVRLAETLCAQNSGTAMARTKALLWQMEQPTLEEALEWAIEENARARMTEDCKAGIAAFLNKEKLNW